MSDLRKPKYVILLRIPGNREPAKSTKIELFEAVRWIGSPNVSKYEANSGRFRIRLNGKWWSKGEIQFFTKTKVKELVFHHITA